MSYRDKTKECRHCEGAHHDCAYVDARNRKIDGAWIEAVRLAGNTPTAIRHFMDEMGRRMGTPNWDTSERRRADARRAA